MSAVERQPTARVLLVDDHEPTREALRAVLARTPDLKVVGEACDGREAVELAQRLHPDLVVMDLHLPVLDGLAATRAVMATVPSVHVVVFTSSNDWAYRHEAQRLGASGYLLKGAPKHEVLATLRAALRPNR